MIKTELEQIKMGFKRTYLNCDKKMKTKKELKEGAYGYKYRIGYEHCKEDVIKLIDEEQVPCPCLRRLKARIEG